MGGQPGGKGGALRVRDVPAFPPLAGGSYRSPERADLTHSLSLTPAASGGLHGGGLPHTLQPCFFPCLHPPTTLLFNLTLTLSLCSKLRHIRNRHRVFLCKRNWPFSEGWRILMH